MNKSELKPTEAGNNGLKLAATDFLDRVAIPYELQDFLFETERGAAAVAHEFNFSERQVVKTLIFQTDAAERVMVMAAEINQLTQDTKRKHLVHGTFVWPHRKQSWRLPTTQSARFLPSHGNQLDFVHFWMLRS